MRPQTESSPAKNEETEQGWRRISWTATAAALSAATEAVPADISAATAPVPATAVNAVSATATTAIWTAASLSATISSTEPMESGTRVRKMTVRGRK